MVESYTIFPTLTSISAYDSIATSMKKDIHPTYYPNARISCACGAVIEFGSTQKEMTTEICSSCHPFYTGKKRLMDTAGKVERFKAREEMTRVMQETKIIAAAKTKSKVTKAADDKKGKPKTTPRATKKINVR